MHRWTWRYAVVVSVGVFTPVCRVPQMCNVHYSFAAFVLSVVLWTVSGMGFAVQAHCAVLKCRALGQAAHARRAAQVPFGCEPRRP